MNYEALIHLDHKEAEAKNVARLERKYKVAIKRDGFNPPTFIVKGSLGHVSKFCADEFGANHGLMIIQGSE